MEFIWLKGGWDETNSFAVRRSWVHIKVYKFERIAGIGRIIIQF